MGAQEAARACQGADGDPVVGHGLRTVEQGHPQGGEQGARGREHPGGEDAPPGTEREEQAEAGQDGQVDPQQGRGRRPGGDRRHQQETPRARGALKNAAGAWEETWLT